MEKIVVGLWAGSSPAKYSLIVRGENRLKKLGWRFWSPPGARALMSRPESRARPFLAGPDEAKIRSLLAIWRRPEIKNIFCLRGGYGTLRLLSHLDRVALPQKKIRLWGYSDLTVIQNYLFQRRGLPWVHSPMISGDSFARPNPQEARMWASLQEHAEDSTESEMKFALTLLHDPKKATRKALNSSLLMIGGNLACLVSMLGTPWEPRPQQAFLLFLEDTHEPAYKLDRLLQQLAHSRMMARCRGIVLGHFTECPNAKEILKLWAQENRFLTLQKLPAGHESPNLPLLLGTKVRLESKKSGGAFLKVPIPFLW